MIEVKNLVYEYPTKRALHGVSFSVQPRTITALVGPNGAGKTTLLRCLAALEMPYDGEVWIDGLDTRVSPRAIHASLGYLPDFFGLYDALSVKRCLYYSARVHGIDTQNADAAVAKAAERVGLSDRINSLAAELSRGLRQRLAIGQSIVHEPRVLMLDEPASGLDPSARRELSQLLVSLKDQGMTLVVSSHILSELEDYSSEMIIIDDGHIVGGARSSYARLRAQPFGLSYLPHGKIWQIFWRLRPALNSSVPIQIRQVFGLSATPMPVSGYCAFWRPRGLKF